MAYADRLVEYPPETVRKVLSEWPETSSYWPTWKELRDALAAVHRARSSRIDELMAVGSKP